MHPEIQKLLQLQEIDAEILKLTREIEQYPAKRRVRQQEVERARKALDEIQQRLRHIELRIRGSESEVETLREKIARFHVQLNTVKNQKEYDAVNLEIEEAREKISEIEENGLTELEAQETAEARQAELQSSLDLKQREAEVEIKRLDEREAAKVDQLKSARERRDDQAARVDPDVLSRYERLVRLNPASCVAPVQDGYCGGCQLKILPKLMTQVRESDKITECASCHRFLYLPE